MVSVLFVCGTAWTDRAIRAVEQAQGDGTGNPLATHVALFWTPDRGVEACFPKVRRCTMQQYGAYDTRRYDLPRSKEQEDVGYTRAYAELGEPYDLWGLVLAFGYVVTRRPWRFLANDKARCHCSALATTVLRAMDVPLLPGVPPSNVTPAALEAEVARVAAAAL